MRKRRKKAAGPFPLKQVLAELGWSQNRLAKSSGIALSNINGLATGRAQPTWPTILHIFSSIGAEFAVLDKVLAQQPVKAARRRKAAEAPEQPAA